MIKLIFSRVKSLFKSNNSNIITLEFRDRKFVLSAYKNKKLVKLSTLAKKYPQVKGLEHILQPFGKESIIPLQNLSNVKIVLNQLPSSIEVLFSPLVTRLKQSDMPKCITFAHKWSETKTCLESAFENFFYLGNGWFVTGDWYWFDDRINSTDDIWLTKNEIKDVEIINFLKDILPDWEKRQFSTTCDLHFSSEPVLEVKIQSVTDQQVLLLFLWKDSKEKILEIPKLDNYVLVNNTIMAGKLPAKFPPKVLNESGKLLLQGEEIPSFMQDTWPHIQNYATGLVSLLRDKHNFLYDSTELILVADRIEHNGIGSVQGIPTFVCGSLHLPAEEVSRSFSLKSKFVYLENGWISINKLRSLGIGPMGRLGDGTVIEPILLKPGEVLKRGSARIEGPWRRIEFSDFDLPHVGKSITPHFEFLRKWGIPGGFVGNFDYLEKELCSNLNILTQQNPDCKILMVGTKKVLDTFSSAWSVITRFNGNTKDPEFSSKLKGLILATPKALEVHSKLISTKWDLLFLLEADTLIKTSSSKLYHNLIKCKKKLVMGLYNSKEFLNRKNAKVALAEVFDIDLTDYQELIWKYGIYDLGEGRTTLVKPYKLNQKTIPIIDNLAEYSVGKPDKSSETIPQRKEQVVETKTNITSNVRELEVQVNMNKYSNSLTSAHNFIEEAKRLVNHSERKASFVPFMSYWPTYCSMTVAQKKWYFWWRNQVRSKIYPDTDLSYIFVHVYEMINDIGVKDSKDGYLQLTNLWSNYRDRYPKLDNYLPQWITDYIIIKKIPVDLNEIIAGLHSLKGLEPDLFVAKYVNGSIDRMPIELIDHLTDYRIRKSKFYNGGYEELIDNYMPKILERINAYMIKREGLGIFDLFKPTQYQEIQHIPFANALYIGQAQKVTIKCIPYSKHPPLREFLTSVVKHTENKLREINDYTGRLRGYNLDDAYSTFIDTLITKAQSKEESKRTVTIDMSRVEILAKESDKVRDKLLLDTIEEIKIESPIQPILIQDKSQENESQVVVRPDETPEGLLTDLEPINRIINTVGEDEKRLFYLFQANGWEIAESHLKSELRNVFIEPLIDQINQYSIEEVGDLLLANENGNWLVTDDFRDELEYLLSLTKDSGVINAEFISTADIPKEWRDFFSNLHDYQYQTLKVIFEENESAATKVRDIAQKNYLMPDLLVDQINEIAVEILGDFIIVPDSSPYEFEEDSIGMLQKIFERSNK